MRVQDFVPAETCHEGQQPSAWASWHRRNGLQGPVSNQMVKIQLPACFPHDLHLLFLTDICAVNISSLLNCIVCWARIWLFLLWSRIKYHRIIRIPSTSQEQRRQWGGMALQSNSRSADFPCPWYEPSNSAQLYFGSCAAVLMHIHCYT